MRLIRARMMLAGGLMAVAAATSGVVLAGPASAGSSQVVLVNCNGAGQVRPAGYDWRSVAFGSGMLKVNDCTPTCAQGTYVKYPILAVLWRAKPWPRHPGQEYFSRLTWIFTAQRPGHAPAAQTFVLPASGHP